LLGLVAGDRNGGPQRLALRLAESLVARQRFEPEDVLERYLQWWRAGGFDTGPIAAAVFGLVEQGMRPQQAVRLVDQMTRGRTAGVGAAHRIAPLGALQTVPTPQVLEAARREARLTHAHPLAGWVSAAVALLVRRLVEGADLEAALSAAAADLQRAALAEGDGQAECVVEILQAGAAGALPVERARPGGYAPETLAAALGFLTRHQGFEAALGDSIAFAGGANYAPVLVGTLAGARQGAAGIPEHWLAHEREMARAFSDLMRRSGPAGWC
jgi:ADP-ribosyl-[dinitrogen reductase] hydrolase